MTLSEPTEYTPLVHPDDNLERPSLCAIRNSSSSSTLATMGDSSSRSAKKKLCIAAVLALLFFATELVTGYLANSLALMSDAFHLLSDVASFIVALVAVYLAEKPPTKRHTFGFHRAEVIAALMSVLTIWALTAFLVTEAFHRLKHPQEIDAKLMCITASIGVAVNVALACVLGGHHHHEEDTGGKPGDEEQAPKSSLKDTNINVRAAALHVLGDLLASIGVLVSSIILVFNPTYTIVDPMCTFFFSIIVLYTTYHLAKDSLAVLMEGAPAHIITEDIEKSLSQIEGVVAVHDLHVWTLSPGKSSLTAHMTVAHHANVNHDDILMQGQRIVSDIYGVHYSTLQIETEPPHRQG